MIQMKFGSQVGFQIYLEYMCVLFGEGKVCLFNIIVYMGVIYDMQSGKCIGNLFLLIWDGSGDMGFYSLNFFIFSFELSFKGNCKFEFVYGWVDRVSLMQCF